MISPPIVGVPALAWCSCGPSSRMCWPNSRTRRYSMNFGPRKMQISIEAIPAIRISPMAGDLLWRRQRLGDRLHADRARALDQDRVAGLEVRVEPLGGLAGVGDQFVGVVFAGARADPDDQSIPASRAWAPTSRWNFGARAELAHLAEHGDRARRPSVARWSSAARIDTGLAL